LYTMKTSAEFLGFENFNLDRSGTRVLEAPPPHLYAGMAQEVVRQLAVRSTPTDRKLHKPTTEELEAFCNALISGDDEAAASIVDNAKKNGATSEAVYLKYLAAAARLLGDWWLTDRASFAQVTVGTGQIFSIMREMKCTIGLAPRPHGTSVIFASVPGEDHTLGIRMAAELFREDGWEIVLKIGLEHDELVSEIESRPGSIVGLSIAGKHSLDALSRLVVALHISCPQSALLVCGQDIGELRPCLAWMGLDCIATDINEAKEKLSMLWDLETSGRKIGPPHSIS
jgi:MerR family transcriptional regulator, light-induced transcriptional regulator